MENSIPTSNSAGNGGPDPATVTNISRWSLSMAASTIDRKFETKVKLGTGEVYEVFIWLKIELLIKCLMYLSIQCINDYSSLNYFYVGSVYKYL